MSGRVPALSAAIDVRDAHGLGSPLNSFLIRTATGYAAGGPLVRGVVNVR